MTHVRSSTYYPQSNGKLERWHKSLKRECIRERTPVSLEDAKCLIQQYVCHYNHVRLHSAIGGWMRHASSASYDADKQTTQGSIQRRSRC